MRDNARGAAICALCLIASWTPIASDFVAAQGTPKTTQPQQVNPKRSTDEDNAREALLRFLFAKQKGDTESKVYFLAIEGMDAKADFLKRFKDNPIPVKNVSQVRYGLVSVPFDKGTHQRGCVFGLARFRWANDDKALVKVHVSWGGKAGFGGTYPVVRQGNRWVVKQPTATFQN